MDAVREVSGAFEARSDIRIGVLGLEGLGSMSGRLLLRSRKGYDTGKVLQK
jgi:hypothetical protein